MVLSSRALSRRLNLQFPFLTLGSLLVLACGSEDSDQVGMAPIPQQTVPVGASGTMPVATGPATSVPAVTPPATTTALPTAPPMGSAGAPVGAGGDADPGSGGMTTGMGGDSASGGTGGTAEPPVMAGGAAGEGAGGEPVTPPTMIDPRGHEGPLFDGLTEAERMVKYYFKEEGGSVVIEAEHFVTQIFGIPEYRGAHWWMVNTSEKEASEHPEFADRCDMLIEELQNLDEMAPGTNQTIRSIVAPTGGAKKLGGGGSLKPGWERVFETYKCDPDRNNSDTASNGSYLELLPDGLYNNNNEIPHAACIWYAPEVAPRVYYRVHFSKGGNYNIHFRGINADTDSGDMHIGVAESPGQGEKYKVAVGPPRTKKWEWVNAGGFSVQAGEYWVAVAGREDGFEVDKIVLSQGGCNGCSGMGPPESGIYTP